MNTKVIELYSGPGTGKSTSAAFLFYLFKQDGYNVELVQEYAKDWAWQNKPVGIYDQIYFLGKQTQRESRLFGKVDYIITDSPIRINSYYSMLYAPAFIGPAIVNLVNAYYAQAEKDGNWHQSVFLRRSKPYNSAGRYQTEEEATKIDKELFKLLENQGNFIQTNTDELSLRKLYTNIIT